MTLPTLLLALAFTPGPGEQLFVYPEPPPIGLVLSGTVDSGPVPEVAACRHCWSSWSVAALACAWLYSLDGDEGGYLACLAEAKVALDSCLSRCAGRHGCTILQPCDEPIR